MEILALINSSLPFSNSTQPMSESNSSSLSLILAFSHPNNATRITTVAALDRNRQAFFLIGMSFLGGLLAGMLLNCFYTFLLNYLFKHLDWEDSFVPEGHVNLSYIGDEFSDPPPDYSAVVGERLGVDVEGGRRAGPFFGFFKRFSRRRTERESVAVAVVDDSPPPSYSSYLVSLENDLNSR